MVFIEKSVPGSPRRRIPPAAGAGLSAAPPSPHPAGIAVTSAARMRP